MTARPASHVIATAALLALVASFLAPFPALAEESPPPVEPAAEATLPPEAAAPEAGPALEAEATPVPTEGPPAEGEVSPAEEPAPVEEPAAEPDLAEVLEAAPQGTTVAVVGEDGTLLPLASDEAAEVIAVADPIWCPASVKAPTPLLNGCSAKETSLTALLAWLSDDVNEPAMDGVIWIEQGIHGDGSTITLDGNLLPANDGFAIMSLYKLTLRGGWDPVTNKVVPGALSTFNVRLQILDWGNDVTLSDILITNAPVGDDLSVRTTGNITLTRVESSGNLGRGALLDNSSATSAKSVTITDSQFNDNSGTGGLSVLSKGAITLTNVIAGYYDESSDTNYGNTGPGAMLSNAYPGVTAGVTLKGVNTFSNNSGTGLTITSNGPITASDLTASNNTGAGRGAVLDNDSSTTAAAITLTGTNIFAGNASTGLEVRSLGPIKLNNLQAHASGTAYGAELINESAATAQAVTLTGTNSFKYNYNSGLSVQSAGAVTLNNITASGNTHGRGVVIDNTEAVSSAVTLTGSSTFNDNYYSGLQVYSHGAFKAANLSASGNGFTSGYGIFIDNSTAATPMAVTLTGKTIASGNYDGGLYLNSDGAVSLQSVTASDNVHGAGARITNNADSAAPQKVTLSGTNVFLSNYSHGLFIESYGAVTLSNLTASGNGTGATGVGASIGNTGATTAQKVSLTGTSAFRDNRNDGLTISSAGAIAASNLTASGNGVGFGGQGASLDNTAAPSAQTVTLTGKNVFSGNEGEGLYVYSIGGVSLASLTADGNVGYGAWVSNQSGPADSPQKVTLSGTHHFADNAYHGLSVASHGAITLSSTVATGNGQFTGVGDGVLLYNNGGGTTPQPITLSGSFLLSGNDDAGLHIEATGIIKASNLTVRDNEAMGVSMANTYLPTTAGITLSGTNRMEGNGYSGIYLESGGPIVVANLTASENGLSGGSGGGAQFGNQWAASPQKVTLTGTNVFNGNYSTGLSIISHGAISVANLSASGNNTHTYAFGASLDNEEFGAVGGVTLTGSSTFNDNALYGLYIFSNGAIALNTTRLEANRNGGGAWGGGVNLSNSLSPLTTLPGVTLKGVSTLNDNRDHGLYLESTGAISISSLTASGNGTDGDGSGAWLYNGYPGSTGGITLSGSNAFNDNAEQGLQAESRGPISVSNLTASGNGAGGSWGDGASLTNTEAPAASVQPVKLTGYGTFHDNLGGGLRIYSLGAISAANVNAAGNQSSGAILANGGPDSVGGVTLSGANVFNDNDYDGLSVNSRGAITVSNLSASGNGTGGTGNGVYVDNSGALTPQPVKLTGYGTFLDNQTNGLLVYSSGSITTANLTARNNSDGHGVYLLNSYGLPSNPGITLSGTNVFTGNGDSGLFVQTDGALTLSKITADDNTASGVYVNWAASLTVTCGSFTHNGDYGLYVNSPVSPMLIGVFASGNDVNLYWTGGTITNIVRSCPLN